MIECAQKAISRPVSRVSPRPLFDRNHCLLSSTKLTRQMGTFNAVPQSAVMRSNSWWRGVSSLRAVRRRFGGRSPRRRGRDASVDATGAPARRGASAAFGMDGRGRVAGASLGPRRSTRRARRRAGAGHMRRACAAEGCAASPGGRRRFTTGRWFPTVPNFAASTCARPHPPVSATTWLRASEPPTKILVGPRAGACAVVRCASWSRAKL